MRYLLVLSFILGCISSSSCTKTSLDRTVFIVAGQSNAMGLGDSITSIFKPLPCYEYKLRSNSFDTLMDPAGELYFGFQQAKWGSFIPAFAFKYSELTQSEVYISQCAKGGSGLHLKAEKNDWGNWSPSGKLRPNCFKKTNKALTKLSEITMKEGDTVMTKYNVSGVIWSQGENDGEAISKELISKQEYKNSLKSLIASFRLEYGEDLPFIIVTTGNNKTSLAFNKGNATVRELQLEVANEDKNTHIGYDGAYTFGQKGLLKDEVHYNQKALNEIGVTLAKFLNDEEIIRIQ